MNATAVLAAAMMGIVLVTVDVSAVNVAAPALGRSFHTGLGDMEWVLNVYSLAYAEDVGRSRSLVVRGAGSGAALPPAAGDLVLLPDPGFVLPPNLQLQPRRDARFDLQQLCCEAPFLNASCAAGS